MQNAKQYLILISISLLVGFGVSYAFTDSPEVRIEKENKQAIRECLSSIDYESTSNQILLATETCSKLEIKKITGGNKLNNETIVSSASGVTKNIENTDIRLTICKKVPNSPLCNEENFNMARSIAYKKALIWGIADRENFFRVGLGIMNSESTIGTNYAGSCDKSYNNFGGIKWRITDSGEAVKDQKIPQGENNNCWLYKFNSLEDYFGSKYNSLGKGYGKCFSSNDAVTCISYAYVGDRNVAEKSWINNVNSIANIK